MKVLLSVINDNVLYSTNHRHLCWEMVYRLSGSSRTAIGSRTHLISPGDLYLIPPDVYHMDESQEPFSDLVIHIDSLAFSDVLVLHDNETYTESLMQMINRIMNKQENNYQNIANSLLDALIQYVKSCSPTEMQNPLVYKLKNVIFENIENCDFNLAREIKTMGYHPDYVRRCFKADTQKTPLAYLTELRINRARQLLIMPTHQGIESISAKCGFRDSFYFSTCFKKHTGLSPLRYRKQNIPQNDSVIK